MCPFDHTAVVVSGKVEILLTGLTTPVGCCLPPTDRPKSFRNRCVIEVFGGVFVLSRCFLDFSVGVGAFVIGLESDIFLFLLVNGTFEFKTTQPPMSAAKCRNNGVVQRGKETQHTLRIYVALAIFQPYRDLDAGEIVAVVSPYFLRSCTKKQKIYVAGTDS